MTTAPAEAPESEPLQSDAVHSDADVAEYCRSVSAFAEHRLGGEDGAGQQDFRRRWALTGRQGVLGASVPAQYGGGGLGARATAAVMEAFGHGCRDTGFAFSCAAHLFACLMPIVHFGSAEQKRRWLPALCSGERIAAHAVTEPGAGSDALHLATRAERRGGHYVLSGSKCFTTNAPVADVLVIQAATRTGGGFFGLSSFVVDADTPGLKVGRPYGKVGLHGSPIADVYLDECAVPAENLLGPEGGGAGVFSLSMRWERTCLFAIYLGAMQRVLDSTVRYAGQREQFGVSIGTFQAVSHRIVDMTLRLRGARLLLHEAARGLDAGEEDEIAPALAKLAVSEAAVQLGLDAVQVRGALGVLDGEAETLLRDALPARIFSGTNEIQRNNVARALGLNTRQAARRG
ncbi:acyl-CoA dehydrogenase family protein [Actinocrinis puniceicyclus]|uniref:Acyl-CoA dehydrogenase family protein n=1 Tax=Actinocrinis puniceicyclus TaxID=977794 RepID=A0A8J8BCX2_9ACTN|nr:L-prolyl-[peptidyl-carrier protein] dehydrogenase [Actinocrinis puniceicyclus]MBS2964643.1 acyl-CoA dehydrogenase family protein [Actinocrinis puniceicyclus]